MNTSAGESVILNYQGIRERLRLRAESAGGRTPPALVAVSKGQEPQAMRLLAEHLLARGERAVFGESYVQEYRRKRPLLPDHKAHFIGRLQRNKVKEAVALFDAIESVASIQAAVDVNAAAERAGKRQDIFLQVNISADPAKAGFSAEALPHFVAQEILRFEHLRLAGLMTITRYYENPEDVRPDYRAAAELHRSIAEDSACRRVIADPFELSMGMSADFEIAAEEGATIVRVGTALFGERDG